MEEQARPGRPARRRIRTTLTQAATDRCFEQSSGHERLLDRIAELVGSELVERSIAERLNAGGGISGGGRSGCTTDSLSFFETPQPELESSIEEGLSTRPEWKSLEQQIKAAEYQKKASSESRLPSAHYSGNYTQLGVTPTTVIPTYTYSGSVTMPIFTGGRIHAEIARANLEIQRIEQQQADLRNSIALDVKTSLINLGSARNEVQVANLGVQLSKEEVDQARDRFQAGVANNIEVIQAQDSLARANDNQIAALYRFNQARADLARAIGQMEKIYSK